MTLNFAGSEEFSNDEFLEIEAAQNELREQWEKDVFVSDRAREFLNSGLGVAIRRVIASNLGHYKNLCTKAKGDELDEAQRQHEIWSAVSNVFGVIIIQGHESLQEIEAMRIQQ